MGISGFKWDLIKIMFNVNEVIDDLNKLDYHFNLPIGVSKGAIIEHNIECVRMLRSKLCSLQIAIHDDAIIPMTSRTKWSELLKSLGVSKVWWMSDDVNDLGGDIIAI